MSESNGEKLILDCQFYESLISTHRQTAFIKFQGF